MKATPSDAWTCNHFGLSNPRGKHEGDLPRLLRRLATQIAALPEKTMILDVTIQSEVTDNGHWFSSTVYYAPDGWSEES